jgi:hypothetical protein
VEADVIARFAIEIESAGVWVIIGAGYDGVAYEAADEIDEGWRTIQFEEDRGFFRQRVIADTPPLFVLRNIVAMDIGSELLDLREEVVLNHLGWEKTLQEDAFGLIPIGAICPLEVEGLDGA